MARGLDELVESLVGEISYFGNGCTVAELIAAIKNFQATGNGEEDSVDDDVPDGADQVESSTPVTDADLSLARIAWDWLVRRGEVRVGPQGEWNHLSIDDVLALPEEVVGELAEAQSDHTVSDPMPSNGGGPPSKTHPAARPRLFVDEETIWKTLTGHGVDYKRVPMLEWKALVGIASAKEAGILQGDLVRLTGQDKRSVPKRTDFLAQKGYITKRTTMVRGSKTSRLWLSKFAPSLMQKTDPSANRSQGFNMSKDALISNLDPVPWCDKWNGDNIDYLAFGQTFMALVKAWNVMRFRDLKQKLGILERQWQMKILAKESRRFVAMGVVKYTAAVFQDNRQVFKDCVKYVRDLTDEEWRKFLATGKRTSQYSDQTQNRQPKTAATSTAKESKRGRDDVPLIPVETVGEGPPQHSSRISNTLSAWVPEKPLSNTVYETVRRAGRRGISNPRLSAATTGFSFRRYMFTNLNSMTTPGTQPIHLRDFQLVNELMRSGKTSAYMYFVKQLITPSPAPDARLEDNGGENSVDEPEHDRIDQDAYGFPKVSSKVFGRDVASLSDLGSVRRRNPRPRPLKIPKTENIQETSTFEATTASMAQEMPPRKPRGRPRKRKLSQIEEPIQIEPPTPATGTLANLWDMNGDVPAPQASHPDAEGPPHSQEIIPGVFIGQPGSLNPNPRGKGRGRPKKSLVVIFKSARIKDLSLSNRQTSVVQSPQDPLTSAGQDGPITENDPASDMLVVVTPEHDEARSPTRLEPEGEDQVIANNEPSLRRGRGRKGAGSQPGKYRCEKCGRSWKNDNGLAYHLEKSQTSCNPNHVLGPPSISEDKPRKRRRIVSTQTTSEPQEPEATPPPITPIASMRSARAVTSPNVKRFARRQVFPATGFLAPMGLQSSVELSNHGEYFDSPQSLIANNDIAAVEKPRPGSPRREGEDKNPAMDTQATKNESATGENISSGKTSSQTHVHSAVYSAKFDEISEHGLASRVGQVEKSPHGQPDAVSKANELDSIFPVGVPKPVGLSTSRQASRTPAIELAPISPEIRPRQSLDVEDSSSPVELTPSIESGVSHPNDDDTIPRFRMPEDRDTTKLPESALRTYQAMEIIRYLLHHNDGVFPAEKALYTAVSKVWKDDIGGDVPPSSYSCGVAVKNLTREKEIKLETYSARNAQGAFVICQLIMKVGVEHHAPAAVAMKKRVLSAHPALYIPQRFSPSTIEHQTSQEHLPTTPTKGPGRRDLKLAEEIEVLDAPFYARRGLRGVRAGGNFREDTFIDNGDGRRKRTGSEDGVGSLRVKRQRSDSLLPTSGQDEQQFIHIGSDPSQLPPWTSHSNQQNHVGVSDDDALVRLASFGTSQRQFSWIDQSPYTQTPISGDGRSQRWRRSGAENPGLSSLPSSFFTYNAPATTAYGYQQSLSLNFLEPNKYLYEEPEEEDYVDPDLPSFNPLPDNLPGNEVEDLEIRANPHFEDCIVLTSIASASDIWPDYSVAFFENNSKSFTMQDNISRQQTILKQSLPQTVDDMAIRTMCHFKPEEWADPDWGKFAETINGCLRYEVSRTGHNRLSMGSVAPDYIFINASTAESVSSLKAVNPQWHPSRDWTLATLPYNDLDSDDDRATDAFSKDINKTNIDPQLYRSIQPPSEPSGDLVSPRKKRAYTKRLQRERPEPSRRAREHTAFPKVSEDYVREKNDKQGDVDWAADDTKIAAFVCVGVLLGGTSKNIDWGLLCRLFPEMKVSALRRFWKTVKKERLSFINDLTDKFQISFVEAYEKRELPPIDFDDVVSYDWPLLLKWTVGLTVQDIVLPGTRKELGDDSCIQTFATENRDWRESYHHWQRSVFNKFQDATSEAATVTLNRSSEQPLPKLMGIAQSWIRALCCTPIHRYTAMDIKNKFLSLGGQSETYINELLENAIIDLERAKIAIKNKSRALATGRPYRLNDHFLKHLDRYAQEEKYALASTFKAQLDETFRRGEIFSVPYLTNDGMILATLNLQAYGRIRVNSVGQPDVPFGFEPGNYETRKFPKSYLHWGLEISPTENYLFDEDIDALGVAKQSVLPRELGDSRLPLWCDFFGVLDNERWAKFLGSVFFMLATRGNMDAEAVSMALQPCVEVFEAEAIMGWAREVGLLQEVTTGGGLTVCEWWWLVVGRQIDREGAKYEGGEELQDEM